MNEINESIHLIESVKLKNEDIVLIDLFIQYSIESELFALLWEFLGWRDPEDEACIIDASYDIVIAS